MAACVFARPAVAQGVVAGNVRISLSASPSTLPADGKSTSRLRIDVRDPRGVALPDNTPVFCHAEGGYLGQSTSDKQQSLTVMAVAGFAIVYCCADTPGVVTVTVRVQDSRNEVAIQAYPEGEAAESVSRVVNIRGGWVGYCPELNTIQARDGARAQIGNLVIDAADGLELRLEDRTLRAWGVRITRKTEKLEGQDCYFALGSGQGVLRRFGDQGIEWVGFSAYSLRVTKANRELPDDAFRGDDREGATWLVCKNCAYFLGQKIVLKHAALYTQGQKVFNFPPFWVIGLAGYGGASNTQVLGVSSDGGLAVDFPLFYRVTDKWAGSIKIQRGVSGASFVANNGWGLGWAEEYDSGTVKGAVEATALGSSTWGLQWHDERPIMGPNQGFFSMALPDHRSVFGDANIYHYADAYRFALRGQLSDIPAEGADYSVNADWLTEPHRLTRSSSWRVGLSVGAHHVGLTGQDLLQNELYGAVDFNTWHLGALKVTPSLSNVYSWDTGNYGANILRADVRSTRDFKSGAHLGLDYTMQYRGGSGTSKGVDHLLALDASLSHGKKWSSYFNASWDMTAGDTYGLLTTDYAVNDNWHVGVLGTHYDYAQAHFNDLEFTLGRVVGDRQLGLRYSLEAHRVSLELGGVGLRK